MGYIGWIKINYTCYHTRFNIGYSDSDNADADHVIHSVNSIITSSTCRFNSRHRHSIEGYRNIQYHMESSKYAINTLRTDVNKA